MKIRPRGRWDFQGALMWRLIFVSLVDTISFLVNYLWPNCKLGPQELFWACLVWSSGRGKYLQMDSGKFTFRILRTQQTGDVLSELATRATEVGGTCINNFR